MIDSNLRPTLIKFTSILLAGHVLSWWIFYLSPLEIPDRFYQIQIKIDGVILVGLLLTILISAQKKLIKLQPEISIFKLTILGTIICFVSEAIFQIIRHPTVIADTLMDHVYLFFLGLIVISLFGTVFSFLIAFQLKTRRTEQLLWMIFGFILLINLIIYLFPQLGGQ